MTEEEIKYYKKYIAESGAFRQDGNLNPFWITTLSKNLDLSKIPGDTVQEKVFVIFKNNGEQDKCIICRKPARFRSYFKGYAKTCSLECKKEVDLKNLAKAVRPEPKPKTPKIRIPKEKKEKLPKTPKEPKISRPKRDSNASINKYMEFLINRNFYFDKYENKPYIFTIRENGKIAYVTLDNPIYEDNYINVDSNDIEKGISDTLSFFGRNYEKEIQKVKNTISKDFPFFNYSERRLRKDYNSLRNYTEFKDRSRLADTVMQQFHKSIYYARVGNKPSPYEAWYNKELMDRCIRNRYIYGKKLNDHGILNGLNVCKIATKVSVFSASLAKDLIFNYLNEFDTIFDPFSGFSGRMLGTCSLNKKYIGQDINQEHVDESNEIIKFLYLDAEVKCKDIFESKGTYDCLFTCPPYSLKEDWGNKDQKDLSCDEWIDVCLKNFKCKKYLFVVDKTEKYKDNIVRTLGNQSHFSDAKEYVILING